MAVIVGEFIKNNKWLVMADGLLENIIQLEKQIQASVAAEQVRAEQWQERELAALEKELDELGVEVVIADARAYLEQSRRRFDAVLEDVFVGTGRNAVKPEWLPEPLDRNRL